MVSPQWKDVSSYSQDDKVREPRTFELRVAGTRLVVTRHIHHAPDAWVLNFSPFVEGLEVGRGTAEEAKGAALEVVRAKLNEVLVALAT
ncbi:hypothetical protein [Azonexus hydrophilus]|uniref:Uncharacterized protein n=1 Tax=Azonexus hydrophilus TaxID=418702 RepID=A0ABZ2XL53_9RHOO